MSTCSSTAHRQIAASTVGTGPPGTIFWINPTQDTITILMTQSSPANPDQLRQRFKALIDKGLTEKGLPEEEKGLKGLPEEEKGLPH